jgi:predicted transposase/invertase (TIGR01784 family)
MERFLNPRNDLMFHKVFGTERNKDVLIGFLNAVFEGVHDPIEDVEFLPLHQNPEIAVLRQSIVDVKCTDTKNRTFIVEMQCYNDPDFIKRACVYASRAYADQVVKPDLKGDGASEQDGGGSHRRNRRIPKGPQYNDLKPVIFLAILYDFVWIENTEKYVHHNKILDTKTHEHNIKEFSYSFIELDKFNKTFEESTSQVDKWCYFFKNAQTTGSAEFEKIKESSPLIHKAYDELELCNYSPEEYEAYWKYEMGKDAYAAGIRGAEARGKAEGLAEGEAIGETRGKAEGLAEGRAEEKASIARSMLSKGLSPETIRDCTGLSIEQIKALNS